MQYSGSVAKPGFSGRWDLRGKKFLFPNPVPLQSWGICVLENCVQEAGVKHFAQVFVQTYISHGGKVANKTPVIYFGSKGEKDIGDLVMKFHDATENKCMSISPRL